jgi:hypothetical protein
MEIPNTNRRKLIIVGCIALVVLLLLVFFIFFRGKSQPVAQTQRQIDRINQEYEGKVKQIRIDFLAKEMACSQPQKNAVIQEIGKKKAEGASDEEIQALMKSGDEKIKKSQEECAKKYDEEMQQALKSLDKEKQAKIAELGKNPASVTSETSTPSQPLPENMAKTTDDDSSTDEQPDANGQNNDSTINVSREQLDNMQKMQDYIKNNPDKLKRVQEKDTDTSNPLPIDTNNLPGKTKSIPPY